MIGDELMSGIPPGVTRKLRVKTENGATDVRGVHTIEVTNGDLSNDGGGVVSIDTSGGGGGGDTYTLQAEAKTGSNVPLKLDANTGSDSTVNLTEGSNITLTRNSATQVTIAASGGGTFSGSIANTHIAYGTGADALGGEAAFTYTAASDLLTVGSATLTAAATADDVADIELAVINGRSQIGKVPVELAIADCELMSVPNRQGRVLVLAQTDYSLGDTGNASAGGPSLINFTTAGTQGLTFGIWNVNGVAANVHFKNAAGTGGAGAPDSVPTITSGIVNGTGTTTVGVQIPAYTFVTVLVISAGVVGFLGDVNAL